MSISSLVISVYRSERLSPLAESLPRDRERRLFSPAVTGASMLNIATTRLRFESRLLVSSGDRGSAALGAPGRRGGARSEEILEIADNASQDTIQTEHGARADNEWIARSRCGSTRASG
jgi:hypothetical protein